MFETAFNFLFRPSLELIQWCGWNGLSYSENQNNRFPLQKKLSCKRPLVEVTSTEGKVSALTLSCASCRGLVSGYNPPFVLLDVDVLNSN